ncbi:MAG: peptidoglycan DD-metalloendopeptidase family protein [Deltaproteobacteria bacterium]
MKTEKEIVKKENELESLKREIVEKKKGLEYNVKKEYAVLEELEDIDKTLSQKEEELEKIEKNISGLKQKTHNTDIRIMELVKEKEGLSRLLEKRLIAMYKMKKVGVIQPFFSSGSVNDIGRRYKYISMVVDYDISLLRDYRGNELLLEAERNRFKEFQEETLFLKDMVEQKRNELIDEKGRKRALLRDIRRKKYMQFAAISEMEGASRELQLFVDRLKNDMQRQEEDTPTSGFASMRGYLSLPVEGRIISMYGKVEHPKFHTATFNNGIEIEAAMGAEVKSVYRGRVAYSGWFRGYGKVMIIDHENGYYTLFARLSKIISEVDSIVEKGDVIALVGDTGSIKGPHLYFEVRQKGVPLDPLNWLAYK